MKFVSEKMNTTDPLQVAEIWKEENMQVALATVIDSDGSAPRSIGSHLAVNANGSFAGSVSGGCVEAEVILQAMDVIETGKSAISVFDIADETAWKAGLSCGGRIRVLVERIT